MICSCESPQRGLFSDDIAGAFMIHDHRDEEEDSGAPDSRDPDRSLPVLCLRIGVFLVVVFVVLSLLGRGAWGVRR